MELTEDTPSVKALREFLKRYEQPHNLFDQALELIANFAKDVALSEREECCKLVYGHASSDNAAERTVRAIRKREVSL